MPTPKKSFASQFMPSLASILPILGGMAILTVFSNSYSSSLTSVQALAFGGSRRGRLVSTSTRGFVVPQNPPNNFAVWDNAWNAAKKSSQSRVVSNRPTSIATAAFVSVSGRTSSSLSLSTSSSVHLTRTSRFRCSLTASREDDFDYDDEEEGYIEEEDEAEEEGDGPEFEMEFEEDEEEEEYEEDEEEEDEEEFEYEYEEIEGEYEEDEEYEEEDGDYSDDDDDNDVDIPLQDDPDDPNYMAQKALVEESVQRRSVFNEIKDMTTGENSAAFLSKNLSEFLDEELARAGVKNVDEAVDTKFQELGLGISEDEATKAIEESIAAAESSERSISMSQEAFTMMTNLDTDVETSANFPPDDDPILQSSGEDDSDVIFGPSVQNADLARLQDSLTNLVGTIEGYANGTFVDNKQAMIRPHYELDKLDQQTLDEISIALNSSATDINGDEYLEEIKSDDPIRWLLYDLNFNVTNLMLAACKHNPDAPILWNQWMPQMVSYSRYADARERDFQFTWDDCEAADMEELRRYYQGMGFDDIPTKSAAETNIINFDTEYDQEDMTMAAFENWMDEVYNEEDENLYFDDEDFQPEHNVYDKNYGMENTDDVNNFIADFRDFEEQHMNATQQFRDTYAKETNYTHVVDEEAAKEFRGHLVVACCGSDHDLDIAEKITLRMKEEFGKKIFVETRVYSHARQEDNLFEIWLESYDIELLHSRRGAFYNSNQWGGPADVDDEQLNNVVERVRYLISDDARYSYHLHEFFTVA